MPSPEELIREVAPVWRWGGHGPITDLIDMVFKLPIRCRASLLSCVW